MLTARRQTGEHDGLAGPDGRGADRITVLRRIEQLRDHVHAAAFDLGGLRILILVDHVLDHVLVERLGHQPVSLGLHPRRHERGQLQPGAAVQQQLVVDQG